MDTWFAKLTALRGLHVSPGLRLGGRCALRLGIGFLLAGAQLGGNPTGLCVGWTAACGGGVLGLAAMVGSLLGALVWWGPTEGLHAAASALLCFCLRFVLRDVGRSYIRIVAPVCAGGTTLILGGAVCFAAGQFANSTAIAAVVTPMLMQALLAAVSALAFVCRETLAGRTLSLCVMTLGAQALPLPLGMHAGGVLAAFLTVAAALGRSGETPAAMALAGGGTLELAGSGGYLLPLAVGVLAARTVQQEKRSFRAAAFLCTALSAVTVLHPQAAAAAGEMALGTALALLAPETCFRPKKEPQREQLRQAATGLRALSKLEDASPGYGAVMVGENLFDRTAERACRSCAGYEECWTQHGARTLAALSTLDLNGARLRREDLPPAFVERCRRPDSFAEALNHQLELQLCRRQGAARVGELRQMQTRRMQAAADLLEQLARQEQPRQSGRRYRVSMGAAAAARGGEQVSGDAGSYCRGPGEQAYLLVCDGMGTGVDAARLSHAAVDALSALLQAGTAPMTALRLLGGAFLARGDGSFATVDLAQIDLATGSATLYKWGAAPSYLITRSGVKRVGTATIPPGLSADDTLSAQTVELSLRRGEVLVLASDGAGGTETERLLGAYDGCAPRELADRLVRAARARAAGDDMTVAVLRLEQEH